MVEAMRHKGDNADVEVWLRIVVAITESSARRRPMRGTDGCPILS
jgi:hypothetical protein